MQRRYRLEYGILKRFDIDGIYPDYRKKEPLIKRDAYHKLNSEFNVERRINTTLKSQIFLT
jgi:myo-inositol catabolism protein IolC